MVEQITAHNLPLGIFQTVEAEIADRELMDGDICILMSDGVLEALGERGYEESICQIIRNMEEQNPRKIAEKLLQFTLYCSEGRVQDDMTILVVGVWENTQF